MTTILIKNATVLTVNKNKDILKNVDILIENNLITKISNDITDVTDKTIDATNKLVMPGLIQPHVHLCQTFFRGMAENLELLPWLRNKIWPLESLHDEQSLYYSSLLGLGELISSGTTTIMDMGSVYDYDAVFEGMKTSGIRAFGGKSMMDFGEGVPENMIERTDFSLAESARLYAKWNDSENGRLQYAFAPRFILSCSDDLITELKSLIDITGAIVQTHAYENKNEGKEIFDLKGLREFEYFENAGLLNEKFVGAHCVWIDDSDISLLKKNRAKAVHCPCSNLKLGSGILNLKTFWENDLTVSIATDGAACNNSLDLFQDLRTTALLHNLLNRPESTDVYKFIELATINGAKTLGIQQQTGSVEVGKLADLIILDINDEFHNFAFESVDIPTKVVFGAKSTDVKTVIIDGNVVMEDRVLKTIDKSEVLAKSHEFTNRFKLNLQNIRK